MFSGSEYAVKFFYVFKNVAMKRKKEEDMAEKVVAYLKEDAFDYYFQQFIIGDKPTGEVADFKVVKNKTIEKISTN